jgi:hypothetical protein
LKTHDNVWRSSFAVGLGLEIKHDELRDVKEFVDHFLYNSILST